MTLSAEGFLAEAGEQIAAAGLAHFDETGLRCQGTLRWVHSVSIDRYVLLGIHPKRGSRR